MRRIITVILIFIAIFALSNIQADTLYNQSVVDELQSYLVNDPCENECNFNLHSLGSDEATLNKLEIDINSDGKADFVLSSRENCGAGTCNVALLVSDGNNLRNVFEGQNIAYLPDRSKGFRDLVQGLRGPGQVNYGVPGKLDLYRWNGREYVVAGIIDIKNTKLTSIYTDFKNTYQNITSFSSEPDIIIKQPQNKAGFELTSLGESYYSGQLLFPRWTSGGQNIQLAVYKSLNAERALVQLWDYDRGGLRLALVDISNKKIINNKFIPEESVLSLGKPDQVKWIGQGVSWSPDSRFAALQYIFAEHEADLAVINLKTGVFDIFPTKISNTVFSVPNLEKLVWKSDDTISVELFQIKCPNDLCEVLAEANDKILSFSLSALINKSSQQDKMENYDQCIGRNFNVQKSETVCGFLLDNEGILHYKNQKVSKPIVVNSYSNGNKVLADSLIIYPSSPSGRYFYIKACEAGQSPLCWSQWVFDSKTNSLQNTSIGKYGAHPEIYWNMNDKLAALFYADEGQEQIYVLDAETGQTWQFPDWNKHDSNYLAIDEKSFAWIDSGSFSIDAAICKENKIVSSNCDNSISSIHKKKTVFKIQGDKLYPSINDLVDTKSQPTLKLSATLLGVTHQDNNLVIKTPPKIWVDIVFQALLEIPSFSLVYPLINMNDVGYIWTVDGELQVTKQSTLSWKFEQNKDPENHVISVKVINRQTGSPILLEPTSMQVSITEEENWNCKGRLGAGCYDGVIKNELTTEPEVLTTGCPQGRICIVSKMSGGSILHDKCCGSNPDGYFCNGPESDKAVPSKLSDCGPQFKVAIEDRLTGKMFDHTWIYPPDGTDPLSAGIDGWWKQLLSSGTTISFGEEMPPSEDQAVCESGSAEFKKGSPIVTNFARGAYPYPSRRIEDDKWICSEIEISLQNTSKANVTNIQQPTANSDNPDCTHPTLPIPISSSLTGSAGGSLNKYNVLGNDGCR
jgi:hypothetical protein